MFDIGTRITVMCWHREQQFLKHIFYLHLLNPPRAYVHTLSYVRKYESANPLVIINQHQFDILGKLVVSRHLELNTFHLIFRMSWASIAHSICQRAFGLLEIRLFCYVLLRSNMKGEDCYGIHMFTFVTWSWVGQLFKRNTAHENHLTFWNMYKISLLDQ